MQDLREDAAWRDTTASALVEAALRRGLEVEAQLSRNLPPLSPLNTGGSSLNLSECETLTLPTQ